MPQGISSSAKKIHDLLREMGFQLEVVEIPEGTRTSADAAKAVGCKLGEIAKSIVFEGKDTNRPVLVITSGSNRVNEKRISELLGEPVTKGDADFVRRRTGFVIGGVPPIGHAEEMKIFIDEDLMMHEVIWAAAGTPHAVFRLTPQDLVRMTEGEVVTVK
jgi:prolyl-tRNA editing enzyme YbaK/EbsC (Cys-tRNA(Pro) deacylase)